MSTKKHRISRLEQQRIDLELIEDYLPAIRPPKSEKVIDPKTENQARYIKAIKNYPLVFGVGPAGVGKTWLCATLAAQALENKLIDKIIVTRPVVETGRSLGFIPGALS